MTLGAPLALPGTARAEVAGGQVEMRAKKLGELVLVADANGGGDRFYRQVGAEEKAARPIESAEPKFFHRRSSAESLEFANEGEFAHLPMASQVIEGKRAGQIFMDKGENAFEPGVARHNAQAAQFTHQGVKKRSPHFGGVPLSLIVNQPRHEMADATLHIAHTQGQPGQCVPGSESDKKRADG